jgi:hypothetical protein
MNSGKIKGFTSRLTQANVHPFKTTAAITILMSSAHVVFFVLKNHEASFCFFKTKNPDEKNHQDCE